MKDRFSAEDEALSNIAREAEARLAAKRAARAEARDIRMRELERQQREPSHHSFDRKWGEIHKWLVGQDCLPCMLITAELSDTGAEQ